MSKPLYTRADCENVVDLSNRPYITLDRANAIHDERCPATRPEPSIQSKDNGKVYVNGMLVADFSAWSTEIKRLWDEAVSVREAHHKEIAELRAELAEARSGYHGRLKSDLKNEISRLREALEAANAVVAFVRRMGHGHAGTLLELINAFHARAALEGKTD